MHSRPSTDSDLACCLISKARPGFVVFYPLIIVAHINCVGSVFGPCFVFLYFFVIILMGKRELSCLPCVL